MALPKTHMIIEDKINKIAKLCQDFRTIDFNENKNVLEFYKRTGYKIYYVFQL